MGPGSLVLITGAPELHMLATWWLPALRALILRIGHLSCWPCRWLVAPMQRLAEGSPPIVHRLPTLLATCLSQELTCCPCACLQATCGMQGAVLMAKCSSMPFKMHHLLQALLPPFASANIIICQHVYRAC